MSELARYVAFTNDLATSNLFIIEILALVVALVFAAILKVMFSPFLDVLPFAETEDADGVEEYTEEPESPLIPVRNATLIVGSITMAAWYFAFFVNYLPPLSLLLLLLLFVVLLSIVALVNVLW
jgi:hypothetical protein